MDFEYEEYPDELYHYGRKGMKWYQHIYGKVENAIERRRNRKNTPSNSSSVKPNSSVNGSRPKLTAKSYKDMNDEELKKATERLIAEHNYITAYNRVNPPSPKKDSFVSKFVNEAVKPSLISSGRNAIQKMLDKSVSKLLGGQTGDELSELRAKADRLRLESQILTNRVAINRNNQTLRDQEAEERNRREGERRQAEAQRQVNEYNNSGHQNDRVSSGESGSYSSRGANIHQDHANYQTVENAPSFSSGSAFANSVGSRPASSMGSGTQVVIDGQAYAAEWIDERNR